MKVIFNGILETKSGGCVPCGQKHSTVTRTMTTKKRYILPSGEFRTFIVGKVEDVTEQDGDFLMSYVYTDKDGVQKTVFTKVE